jgi:predicted RNase H-like HicB family nuclease
MSHQEPRQIRLPPLNILFFKEQGFWVAQCLQVDVTSQGETIEDARKSFERVLVAQVMSDLEEKREPLSCLPEAPAKFWHQFRRASALAERGSIHLPELPTETPPAWMIPYLTLDEMRVI